MIMTEEETRNHNADYLLKIDEHAETGNVRGKVGKVLERLSVYMPAIIHRDVFRSEVEQLKKYNLGYSFVTWGFHCFTRDGKPASLAADIVSAEYAYFDDKQFIASEANEYFWLLLGSFALENGLNWGGFWGLEKGEQGEIRRVLESNKFSHMEDYAYLVNQRKKRLGLDVAHIECSTLTLNQAYKLRS